MATEALFPLFLLIQSRKMLGHKDMDNSLRSDKLLFEMKVYLIIRIYYNSGMLDSANFHVHFGTTDS